MRAKLKPLADGTPAELRRYEVIFSRTPERQIHRPHLHLVEPEVVPLAETSEPPQPANLYPGVAEHLRPREYEMPNIIRCRLGNLIMLAQQRGEKNPELQNLAESIENDGLMYAPNVIRINGQALGKYIEFTNRLWGSNNQLADMEPDESGNYLLVAAGHSRVTAMIMNETERSARAAEAGFQTNWQDATMPIQLHDAETPYDILSIQIAENTHSKPSEERTAMGVVEMYLFGLEDGQWKTKKQFLEQMNGKYSRKLLNDAISFAELPVFVRNKVSKRFIKYGPAVELARTVEYYQQHCLDMYFGGRTLEELSVQEAIEFKDQIIIWMHSATAKIEAGPLNITNARKYFAGQRNMWDKTLAKAKALASGEGMFMDSYELRDSIAEWARHRRRVRQEYARSIKKIGAMPILAADSLKEHLEVLGTDSPEYQEIDAYLRSIGQLAASGSLKDYRVNQSALA